MKFPSLLHQCYWSALEAKECTHEGFVVWNDLTEGTAAELARWMAEEKARQAKEAEGSETTPQPQPEAWAPVEPALRRALNAVAKSVPHARCRHDWGRLAKIGMAEVRFVCRHCRNQIDLYGPR